MPTRLTATWKLVRVQTSPVLIPVCSYSLFAFLFANRASPVLQAGRVAWNLIVATFVVGQCCLHSLHALPRT